MLTDNFATSTLNGRPQIPHARPQSLWKSWGERRAGLISSLPCYAILYLVPTGFFSATANNVMFFVCRPSNPGFARLGWFCESPLLQFVVTVVLPFVLLMLWQNMVIPQVGEGGWGQAGGGERGRRGRRDGGPCGDKPIGRSSARSGWFRDDGRRPGLSARLGAE